MLGEREAVVVDVVPVSIHGMVYVDVTVRYPDEVLEAARLGLESTPDGLQVGEQVLVSRAVNMIVALRRP